MEALYLRTAFGATPRSPSHQRFMGWFNRLGLWASSPIFRAWWPWVAPFRSGKFNSFMEIEFDLHTRPFRDGVIEPDLDVARPTGLAMVRWAETADPPPHPPVEGSRCFGYRVLLGGRLPEIDAALIRFVEVPEADDDASAEPQKGVKWWRDDVYVTPGLWSLSIGECFLQELLYELHDAHYARAILDLTPRPTADNPTPKPTRLSSSWMSLYTGAGFRRVDDTLEPDLTTLPPRPKRRPGSTDEG